MWRCGAKSLSSTSFFAVYKDHSIYFFFFFQAEDGIRDLTVTGVQTCALPICEDPDVSGEVEKILEEDGIEILNSTQVTLVEKMKAGVRVVLGTGKRSKKISGSHLLLALGRVPNSDRLNLGAAGVETDNSGFIKVNPKLETTVPGIYAIGDVKGGPAFTHISYDDFRILREHWINGGNATIEA